MAVKMSVSPFVAIKNPKPQKAITEVSWKEVKKRVQAVRPDLAKILDKLDSPHPLFLNTYSYGATIADPQTNPGLSLILEKRCELFFEYPDIKPTYRVYRSGNILCAWHIFADKMQPQAHDLWKLTAGCRSVYMLPKISALRNHKVIQKKYDIGVVNPQELDDHWDVFYLIANSKVNNPENAWKATLLTFSDEWFTHRDDPAWAPFYHCIEHSLTEYRTIDAKGPWLDSIFGGLMREKGINMTDPLKEQMKTLVLLASSGIPGFREADEEALPLQQIQEAYTKHYGIKEYAPIIVAPEYMNWQPDKNLYYSLNHPTSYMIAPYRNKRKSMVRYMFQLYWNFERLRSYVFKKLKVSPDSEMYQVLSQYAFDFYHDEAVEFDVFKFPEQIVKDDPDFMKSWPGRSLQAHSYFLNGCVRIQRKS